MTLFEITALLMVLTGSESETGHFDQATKYPLMRLIGCVSGAGDD